MQQKHQCREINSYYWCENVERWNWLARDIVVLLFLLYYCAVSTLTVLLNNFERMQCEHGSSISRCSNSPSRLQLLQCSMSVFLDGAILHESSTSTIYEYFIKNTYGKRREKRVYFIIIDPHQLRLLPYKVAVYVFSLHVRNVIECTLPLRIFLNKCYWYDMEHWGNWQLLNIYSCAFCP